MEDIDHWRLCGELTVIQAALLTVGIDPTDIQELVEKWKPDERPPGYEAIRTAITNALRSGEIEGTLLPCRTLDRRDLSFHDVKDSMDIARSRVRGRIPEGLVFKPRLSPCFFLPT